MGRRRQAASIELLLVRREDEPMTNYMTIDPPQTRRDSLGRYLVTQPQTNKLVPYSRVTTIAKVLDSGAALAPWKAAMTATGLIMRRGLRAQWEELLARYGEPWYAGDDAKSLTKNLVEECATIGGASERKQLGAALHTITAIVDCGRSIPHLTEETERDVKAYQAGLAEHHIQVLPEQIELTVVLDNWEVAGTFDRLCTVPGYDLPLIADIKTGSSVEFSWPSFAVQLAAYSRANAIYQQGDAADGSQDRRLSMPEVDQKHGLILWLNAGKGTLEPWIVDLNAGWEGFEKSMWTRIWHRLPIAEPLDRAEQPNLATVLQMSLPHTQLKQWLQDRINNIGQHPEARTYIQENWPKDIEPLKSLNRNHTEQELTAIDDLLTEIERRFRLSFPPDKPTN
jgi:hypothetical protein